jgi:Domain of unknown function (DUF4258)
MFERGVSIREVQAAIEFGETVASYPDDLPYPSALVLGLVAGRPIHVVVGREPITEICYVITAYEPNSELWEADFKRRKRP